MNSNGKRSVICAALALPVAVLLSSVVSWYFKSRNPDNVDITAGLAYLRPILLSAIITFVIFILVGLLSAIRGLRNDSNKELSILGLILVVVVTVISLSAGIASSGAGKAEDAYRDQKAKAFFDKLNEQSR